MHKLINYVCDELEKIEQQVGNNGKLSVAEIEYADKLAHLKKNLLRADELMESGYSGENRRWPSSFRGGRSYEEGGSSYGRDGSSYGRDGSSYARESSYGREGGSSYGRAYDGRGRGSNAQRDSRGRYSSARNYSRYVRDDYSMATDEVVQDLRGLMEQAPDQMMREELQRVITKVEQMDD